MSDRYAGLPISDDDAAIAAALEDVSVPTLLVSLVHLTGDPQILRGPLRPWAEHLLDEKRLREQGLDPDAPVCRQWMALTEQLINRPRHLSQHPGGFVIARDDVSRLVPVENAAMDGRTVIQWDKDDLDALKLIKVDILALGMLSAIRRALQGVA